MLLLYSTTMTITITVHWQKSNCEHRQKIHNNNNGACYFCLLSLSDIFKCTKYTAMIYDRKFTKTTTFSILPYSLLSSVSLCCWSYGEALGVGRLYRVYEAKGSWWLCDLLTVGLLDVTHASGWCLWRQQHAALTNETQFTWHSGLLDKPGVARSDDLASQRFVLQFLLFEEVIC